MFFYQGIDICKKKLINKIEVVVAYGYKELDDLINNAKEQGYVSVGKNEFQEFCDNNNLSIHNGGIIFKIENKEDIYYKVLIENKVS